MQFKRYNPVRARGDVISGILNCVCPGCGGRMVNQAKSSSAGANVSRTGVRYGSEPCQLDFTDDRIGRRV
jgi:hypothetical protein